jgi:hypothetical protein
MHTEHVNSDFCFVHPLKSFCNKTYDFIMLVWKSELLIIVIWSIFCRLFWVKSYYKEPVWYAGHAIDIYESQKWIQWNLFKPNFQGTIFCVLNKQMFGLCRVKPNWRRFPTLRLYLKFVLCRVGFGQFTIFNYLYHD